MKTCTACNIYKEFSYFAKNKLGKDGLHSKCRVCQREYRRSWYVSNKENARAINKKWADNNPSHSKEWYQKNKLNQRDQQLRKQFGITLEQYDQMLLIQDSKCKICGLDQKESVKALAVDHCHATGKIRGLLCGKCNLGIGYFQDREDVLNKAIEYLRESK